MKHRHPFRAIIGGLLLGLGLAIATIVYAIAPLGAMTPWVALVVGLVIGILLMFIPSIRKGRRKRPTYAGAGSPPR
jgi:hypothetical protein